jgi:hypothetical protein
VRRFDLSLEEAIGTVSIEGVTVAVR